MLEYHVSPALSRRWDVGAALWGRESCEKTGFYTAFFSSLSSSSNCSSFFKEIRLWGMVCSSQNSASHQTSSLPPPPPPYSPPPPPFFSSFSSSCSFHFFTVFPEKAGQWTPVLLLLASVFFFLLQMLLFPLSLQSIGRFSEAGLLEWMRFVIFCARSRERSQRTSGPISE